MGKMTTLKKALSKKLTKKQLSLLPRSYDTIGEIAIFSDFPKELKRKEKIIAETLLRLHKNIKTVAKKTKKHYGVYRLRKVKILAGKRKKTTLHKESKALMKVNVETCYFSPRSSSERLRVANLVKKDEKVLVMFSGVLPFPLVIVKNSKPKIVYAVELSKNCHKYALENIKLNKADNIKAYCGDVKKVLPRLRKRFDRILMPLPQTSERFLHNALKVSKRGTIIHLYKILSEKEVKDFLKDIKEKYGVRVLRKVKAGHYGPGVYRYCFDLKV